MSDRYPTTRISQLLRREDEGSFITTPQSTLSLVFDGIMSPFDDKHFGRLVRTGARDDGFRRTGIKSERPVVLNQRQVSVIDADDLDYIADGLQIDPDIIAREYDEPRRQFMARHMGVNVVVDGPADSLILNGTTPPYRIGNFDEAGFLQTALLIISYNRPCSTPGRAIAAAYPGEHPYMGRKFLEVARAHRGYVGVVSSAGGLSVGEEVMAVELPKRPED